MTLPDDDDYKLKLSFACVGVQKAGTTSLDGLLRRRADIVLPKGKETKFFHDDSRDQYKNGDGWYFNKYYLDSNVNIESIKSNGYIFGEIDPEYIYFEEVPYRLHAHNNKMKIVVMLRDPVHRAYSHYLMSYARGIENLSFDDAIEAEQERISKDEFSKNHFSYFSRGLYFDQVMRYVNLFGRENVIIIPFERFIKNQKLYLEEILCFIGASVGNIEVDTGIIMNEAKEVRVKMLRNMLFKDNVLRVFFRKIPIPDGFKYNLKNFLVKIALRKAMSKPSLGLACYSRLRELYREDVSKLDKYLATDFEILWFSDKQ